MVSGEQQATLARPARIAGIGIHGGQAVHLTLHPAAPDTGVRFRRVDLPGSPEVPAIAAHIDQQPRRTALRRGPAEVHTCEHLLAATRALGVDNLIADLDGAELPGCDGSSLAYVEAIREAGIAPQGTPRRTLVLSTPVSVISGARTLIALPYPGALRVTYCFAPEDGAFGGPRVFDITVDADTFTREIAPARTFVTLAEAELARAAGLGLGATYDNTLVWDGEQVLNNTLRFDDEPARHKALDVIGDLALAGRPLHAHVIAQRTGHPENLELLRRILAGIPSH